MATRLYPAGGGNPAEISPAFAAGWGVNSGTRLRLASAAAKYVAGGGGGTNVTIAETSAAAIDLAFLQTISDPIAAAVAFTTADTVHGQMLCSETASGLMRAQMTIRVLSRDGATVRATLLALDDATALTSEFSTTKTNRKFPVAYTGSGPTLAANYTCVAGDRLCVEWGARATNSSVSSFSANATAGGAGSDLPVDETTTTTTFIPWIEFSTAITFEQSGPTRAVTQAVQRAAVR